MAWKDTSDANCYDLISDDSYYQPLCIEYVPSALFNGVAFSFNKFECMLRTRERVTEWRGLTKAAAFKITGDTSEQQQSSGTYQFEKHNIKVSRRKANAAGGWTVTKTEKWSALYINGTWDCGAPEATFTGTTAPNKTAS